MARTKAETVATFVVKLEAFMQPIISPIAKPVTHHEGKFRLHYYAVSPQI
jgi:hypothetical protein